MQNNKKHLSIYFLTISVLILSGCCPSCFDEVSFASGNNGMVVSSHPIASEIGLNVLKNGGNAIDAAIATGFVLGVVDQFNSGIGGGGFIVIRLADGTIYTIDGRETAPAAVTRDMYLRDGKFDPDMSKLGPLAVGVPGILAAYVKALELAGTQTLSELISPSIKVARKGFALNSYYLSRYNSVIDKFAEDPASAKIYLNTDSSHFKEGDVLIQQDLAATYQKIAHGGPDYFYRGEFAEKLAEYMAKHGGLITKADMENYRIRMREPIMGTYHQFTVIGMAPPSSGGVHVIQILKMLEASGVLEGKSEWDWNSVYWTTQFMRKAFEDRALHLGDSDFYPVPVERLISKSYADSCVKVIMNREQTVLREVQPITDLVFGHTTNFAVIDKWGNAVAVNQTVNLTYGAKITLPGTGVVLNNQMDDFSAQPGVPNAFGLIGNEANSIAPGKRPLSSMSPTIVVNNGKPVMILGGAGGPTIITAVLHNIIGVLDFGLDLTEAQIHPRFHHQFIPDKLYMEDNTPIIMKIGQWLKGVKVDSRRELGRVQAIAWSDREQAYVGVPDPRGKGSAAAY